MHTGASFHPNEVGMAAIAAEWERVLTSDFHSHARSAGVLRRSLASTVDGGD